MLRGGIDRLDEGEILQEAAEKFKEFLPDQIRGKKPRQPDEGDREDEPRLHAEQRDDVRDGQRNERDARRTEQRVFHWGGADFVPDPTRTTPLPPLPSPTRKTPACGRYATPFLAVPSMPTAKKAPFPTPIACRGASTGSN